MARLIRRQISPLVAGLALGTLAVVVGAFSGLSALDHYGFCTTCHGHDLVVGLAQKLGAVTFGPAIWPILTTVGVALGAWGSSRVNGETPRRSRRMSWPAMLGRVALGFVVMSLALLAMGCPIRMTIRAADLNLQGMVGLAGVAAGVAASVAWLKGRA
ncbi:MAG: hypothetical protein AB1801_07235 [Chloroflexota bacterium]